MIGIIRKISGSIVTSTARLSPPDLSLTSGIRVDRLRETRGCCRESSALLAVAGKVAVIEAKVELKAVLRFVLTHFDQNVGCLGRLFTGMGTVSMDPGFKSRAEGVKVYNLDSSPAQ